MASGDEHRGEGDDYGDAATMGALRQLYAGYAWADVASLEPAAAAGRAVRVRGAAQAVRAVGRRVAFLVLRQGAATVQCVVAGGGMARFAAGLSRESVVDVAGVVSLPREPVRGTTQQVLDVLTHLDWRLCFLRRRSHVCPSPVLNNSSWRSTWRSSIASAGRSPTSRSASTTPRGARKTSQEPKL